jgi:hypothetical protein
MWFYFRRQSGRGLVDPVIVLCYEEPGPELERLIQAGNFKALIGYLQRGWEFRPDRGDHDRGPESLKGSN